MSKSYKYRLVSIGDSLTQGFLNGCMYSPNYAYPYHIAQAMGKDTRFEQANFSAQAGIPLNFEMVLRGLEEELGTQLQLRDYPKVLSHLFKTARRIKSFWEGRKMDLSVQRDEPWQNQSIWGIMMNDAWQVTEQYSRDYMRNNPIAYSVFNFLPDHAQHMTARRVLNPSFSAEQAQRSGFANLQWMSEHGGIENLICYLGANHVIGAATYLRFVYSERDDVLKPLGKRKATVYRPEHFEMLYREMAVRVQQLKAKRVFVGTIPFPSIPPITRGVNADKSIAKGYFDYYTRFWIWDDAFNPERHPHLTKEQVMELDLITAEYNRIIKRVAAEHDWHVIEVDRYVGAMARRRLGGNVHVHWPDGFNKAMKANPKTSYLVGENGQAMLSTDYIRLHPETGHIIRGGIFSLDALHPTVMAYGLIANMFYEKMKKAGVSFERELDWDAIVASDTLITQPPKLLIQLKQLFKFFSLDNNEQLRALGSNLFLKTMGFLRE